MKSETFFLRVDRKHKLRIALYPTFKAMRKAACRVDASLRGKSYYGCCTCSLEAGKEIVGRIFLSHKWCGAGVVAHELLHFLLFWAEEKGWLKNLAAYEEKMVYFYEQLVRKYWIAFYKLHPEQDISAQRQE
jgi:hypothetical protein